MSNHFARIVPSGTNQFPASPSLELTCRTDSLAALRAAVDHGANSIRLKCRPRGQQGVGQHEFQRAGLRKAVHYALESGCTVSIEVDPSDGDGEAMRSLLWRAFDSGIRDISLASPALALYLRTHHPHIGIRFMLDEDGVSRRGIELLRRQLGVTRIVLPRVTTLRQVQLLGPTRGIELELQVHGPGCALVSGCQRTLHSCSPAGTGGYELCGDSEGACNDSSFPGTPSNDLASLALLPDIHQAGVRGLIIEAPTRSPARMAQLAALWRDEIDAHRHTGTLRPLPLICAPACASPV